MTLVRACAASDLVEGTPTSVQLGDERLVLVRHDGEIHAIRDECSHAGILLSIGDFDAEECALACYGHGSRFSLKTGRPLELPAHVAVPVYPTSTRGEDVLVDLSQPIQES